MVESMKFMAAQVVFFYLERCSIGEVIVCIPFCFLIVSYLIIRLASMKEVNPFNSFQSSRALLCLRFEEFWFVNFTSFNGYLYLYFKVFSRWLVQLCKIHQGGLSDGYKNYIAEKEIPDGTYTEDGVALFRVQGSGPDDMQAIQVEAVCPKFSYTIFISFRTHYKYDPDRANFCCGEGVTFPLDYGLVLIFVAFEFEQRWLDNVLPFPCFWSMASLCGLHALSTWAEMAK